MALSLTDASWKLLCAQQSTLICRSILFRTTSCRGIVHIYSRACVFDGGIDLDSARRDLDRDLAAEGSHGTACRSGVGIFSGANALSARSCSAVRSENSIRIGGHVFDVARCPVVHLV